MAVFVYKDGEKFSLVGKKIFHKGNWFDLSEADKIKINGKWYSLGNDDSLIDENSANQEI